jgi:hypothetical protein
MNPRIALLPLLLCAITVAAATTTNDTVGMIGTPIRVPAGTVSQPIRVFVFASGDEVLKQETKIAELFDVSGNADGVETKFERVDVASVSETMTNAKLAPSRIEWIFLMTIKGAIPPAKTLTREAQLVVGTAKRHFTYELTSKITPLTWTLNQPMPAVSVTGERSVLGFSVTATGEGEQTSVRITRATIRDANNRPVDLRALSLADCPVAVGTPSPQRLIVDGNNVPAGNYNGTIEISLLGAADAKTFDLALSSSPPRGRLIGFFCVFGGVLLAMFLAGFLRNLASRLAALLPANRVRDLLKTEWDNLTKKVAATEAANTKNWIDEVSKWLDPETLRTKGYVPGWLPAAFGAGNVDAQGYATYLQSQGDEVASITHLIERGFLLVTRYTSDPAVIKTTYKNLDELAVSRPTDLGTQTDAIITALKSKSKQAGALKEPTTTLTHHILLRLDIVNATAWLIFAVIATVTGYLVAVNISGFGVTADYIKAFLWGLGLQTAGTQLQQLTPSSVASSIGITMPTRS